MKKPLAADRLSLMPDGISRGPYPPSGFLTVWDADLGNGDYFGLYWPLGREQDEPVVCDMAHDSWTMIPCFSNATKFADWLEANDYERGDCEPEDSDFAPAHFRKGKELIATGQIPEAIAEMKQACSLFPESSEYWSTLAGQLRRVGQQDDAVQAAIHAYASNWTFGSPADSVLRTLQSAQRIPQFANEPLIKRTHLLTNRFGGEKANDNYALLRECVEEYLAQGQFVRGLLLHQNRALMMQRETVSFRERYHFTLEGWQHEFSTLCEKHLGDSRKSLQ